MICLQCGKETSYVAVDDASELVSYVYLCSEDCLETWKRERRMAELKRQLAALQEEWDRLAAKAAPES